MHLLSISAREGSNHDNQHPRVLFSRLMTVQLAGAHPVLMPKSQLGDGPQTISSLQLLTKTEHTHIKANPCCLFYTKMPIDNIHIFCIVPKGKSIEALCTPTFKYIAPRKDCKIHISLCFQNSPLSRQSRQWAMAGCILLTVKILGQDWNEGLIFIHISRVTLTTSRAEKSGWTKTVVAETNIFTLWWH